MPEILIIPLISITKDYYEIEKTNKTANGKTYYELKDFPQERERYFRFFFDLQKIPK